MAAALPRPAPMTAAAAAAAAADESDYGSELDEATVDALYAPPERHVALERPVLRLDDHGYGEPRVRVARDLHVAPALARRRFSHARCRTPRTASGESESDPGTPDPLAPPPDESSATPPPPVPPPPPHSPPPPAPDHDTRAPLLRFRPHKPLSVTDLIAPAWCELQYFYGLSRFGRVRQTPAMKQGSSVHRVLEQEVHTEIPVHPTTAEERFAVRVWNVVHGLRTLRRGGMTRELEVWGVVAGEVVNGVVDQVSFACPDEQAEAEVMGGGEGGAAREGKSVEAGQRTLAGCYSRSPQGGVGLKQTGAPCPGTLQVEAPGRQLYLVDVKTRQSTSLPPPGSQTRPTHYQLMLYHRLLSDLAADRVDAAQIFARYRLNPHAAFSDAFLAQMSQVSEAAEAPPNSTQPADPLAELLSHPTLAALWTLMMHEFALVLPRPPTTISPFLTAEFRAAASGAVIGRRHFRSDARLLDAYVRDELAWWRGERAAKGVEVEEAGKCRICEFAEGCEWRVRKAEEGLERVRARKEARGKGGR